MVLNLGKFASFLHPRAYVIILDTSLVVLGEEECYWHLLLIYNEQDASTTKIHWVQNGNIVKVDNPDLVCQSLFLCSNWYSWFSWSISSLVSPFDLYSFLVLYYKINQDFTINFLYFLFSVFLFKCLKLVNKIYLFFLIRIF